MSTIGCLSLTGCRASLALLERSSYPADEQLARLPGLLAASGADQLAVLSTCERTEFYAVWSGEPDHDGLVRTLAADRDLPYDAVDAATVRFSGADAVAHLFRVATGLESFVIGDADIVGQVRTAAELCRTAGVDGLELDRLMGAAISTSRRAHRRTSFERAGRSVGAAAVDAAAALNDGSLAGRRLLVVGAGQVAAAVVARAGEAGASVTVCNRTRRRAERFTAAGAEVVDLAQLGTCLAEADVVILGAAAPHPLIDRATIDAARGQGQERLLLLDLCLPRTVDPAVRGMPAVRLVDLADLRTMNLNDIGTLAEDAAIAGRIVEEQVERFVAWLAGRPAAEAVRRLRADSEAIARGELDVLRRTLPGEVYEQVERTLIRAVHKLTHGPTRRLVDAAEAGDQQLVELLTNLFGTSTEPVTDPVATANRIRAASV